MATESYIYFDILSPIFSIADGSLIEFSFVFHVHLLHRLLIAFSNVIVTDSGWIEIETKIKPMPVVRSIFRVWRFYVYVYKTYWNIGSTMPTQTQSISDSTLHIMNVEPIKPYNGEMEFGIFSEKIKRIGGTV